MAFRLEALGGLRLIAADGQMVQMQRRRLALLALLAAAGERGLTRDRLVGDLWPETTQERAKHALNQLLYGVRLSLGEGALSGTDTLSLDPSVVDSDVGRFERALSAGAYGDAVAHYRGPFLDGFYLPDAPQFERRVEAERARIAAEHATALERLAAEAESRGDLAALVACRRTLAELDRLDSRRAIALMRALAAAGDSSGALSYARAYEALVREELDAPADPAVIALANEIRTAATRSPATSSRGAPPSDPPASEHTLVNGAPGVAATNDISPPQIAAVPRPRVRPALVYGLAAIALTTATFAVRHVTSNRSASAAPAATSTLSIAVLPLKNLSTNPADASLADGMTEALISTLSRAGKLRVIPSTSVFALRDQHMDVRQIAESLHVKHVLEGGVQKAGTRLRLQARLVDARDGSTRWSETYDREMGDVFAVQDDISRSVARELDVRLAAGSARGAVTRRRTPSIEAYEWYLRGMDLSLMRTAAGQVQAADYFNRAIAADSSFAAAYAGLARTYLQTAGSAPGNSRAAFAKADWAARTAVALDDSLAEAYVALGWAREARREWAGAEAALKRAIALDPRAPRAYEGLARVYMYTGRRAEQLTAARTGVEIDPFSASAIRELALALQTNGRCDEALELLLPLKTLTPPARVAGVIRGQCYAAKRMWPEAIAEFRWAMEGDARTALAFLGYALARGGHEDEAKRILSELLSGRKNSHGAFGIAAVYAGLGNFDEAFAWLDKAVDESTVRVYIMGPMFEDLQRDPRFAHFKRRYRI
ncbi:MAG: BTAD domain-containing putative transcriptional regulator [Gemmatimonadaceae bacterium]